jgi:hypothetical protein
MPKISTDGRFNGHADNGIGDFYQLGMDDRQDNVLLEFHRQNPGSQEASPLRTNTCVNCHFISASTTKSSYKI